MKIDLSRFHQTFFDESFEGLDAMESALLNLDPAAPDAETVNTIFRAAHSIKGGAGTFGFTEISAFTHIAETLLDQVRSGERQPDRKLIDLMLSAVDRLRSMLTAAQAGEPADSPESRALQAQLEMLLSSEPARAETAPAGNVAAGGGWLIEFRPHPRMLASGNDPLRILRELGELGGLEATVHLENLPALADLDATDCMLAWTLRLSGDASRDAVGEVFSWVEDECELQIEPIATPAGPAEAPPKAQLKAVPGSGSERSAGSIRVATEKIDALINLVGELVITQAMLQQLSGDLDPMVNEKMLAGLGQLDRNTRHLQEAIMSTRMLPVDFVFSRFPRLVRDLAGKLGKKVELRTAGEGAELDKGVIEKIVDPLNHIVRNSIDHGVELPEHRKQSGKSATAVVSLSAWHQGGHIVIEVADDGRGLDREKILSKAHAANLPVNDAMPDSEVWQLIFHPGLSTAEEVTDVSGRGVGMDVVKKNIQSLGGGVEIQSQTGVGTRVTIRLPLTLAIMDGMSVEVGGEIYILPLSCVVESMQPRTQDLKTLVGEPRLIRVREEFIPLVPMHEFFDVPSRLDRVEEGIVVLVEAEGRTVALVVDELVGQQQVVIKSLESNYRRIRGVSGATILGDGRVALIIDAGEIVRACSQLAAA